MYIYIYINHKYIYTHTYYIVYTCIYTYIVYNYGTKP